MSDNAPRMPALFLAHGNPMNALYDNEFTRALGRLTVDIPTPSAILVVSAHWETHGTRVTVNAKPPTIHDFGGFPRELYEVEYPAPGSPALAERVCELVPGAEGDDRWGLDHASWTVLRHMWPDAEIPVVELSLAGHQPAEAHFELGKALAPLRDEGVLVTGSGNIVHSFAGIEWSDNATPKPWAEDFDAYVADALVRGDDEALVEYERAGAIAKASVPTDEHYLPLLYIAATRAEGESMSFPYAAIDMGSMSMRCVRFG